MPALILFMKKIFLIVALFCATASNAQKDFEGMIRYKATSSYDRMKNDNEKPDTSEIIVFFTRGRLKTIVDKSEGGETKLIILDSAKSYILNKEEKTYQEKNLIKRKQTMFPDKENILGYTATEESSHSSILLSMPGEVHLWFADSLFFHIPPELERNEELAMIAQNRILLKAVADLSFTSNSMRDDTVLSTHEFSSDITLTAVEIKPGGINPADFEIPAGYSKQIWPKFEEITIPDNDTAVVASPAPAPAKKPVQKTPVKKPPTTTSTKSPAKKND